MEDAVYQLRSLLGDLSTDKFQFKVQAFPATDGITTVFHFGETLLVAGSLEVFLDGLLVEDPTDYTSELETGTIEMLVAPPAESVLQASYHFQWFIDSQAEAFLTNAGNLIGLEFVTDETLPFGLRPALLHFACYYAYMKKAADTADSLVASAEGYQVDQSKSFPNWKRLAENAWEQAKAAIEFFNENPLNVGGIGMAIVSYRIPNYVPPS
jgi:hypothetical protein